MPSRRGRGLERSRDNAASYSTSRRCANNILALSGKPTRAAALSIEERPELRRAVDAFRTHSHLSLNRAAIADLY
jgi:hypothetical protein